jgi:hypothetical protein
MIASTFFNFILDYLFVKKLSRNKDRPVDTADYYTITLLSYMIYVFPDLLYSLP